MSIIYSQDSEELTVFAFLELLKASYPHRHFESERLHTALQKTINITAWNEKTLVGAVGSCRTVIFLVPFRKL